MVDSDPAGTSGNRFRGVASPSLGSFQAFQAGILYPCGYYDIVGKLIEREFVLKSDLSC